jgi:hypothetical protein
VSLSSADGCEIRYTLDGQDPSLASEAYAAPITITQTRTLKARTFCDDGRLPSGLTILGFTSDADFHPGKVSPVNLKMWLRADAGLPSRAGDFWVDQSGTGNHGHQAASGATAKLGQDSVSGLPVLTFDGSDDFFSFTAPPAGQQLTVFWVVGESTAATSSVRRSLLGDASNNTFLGGPGAPGIIWDSAASSLVRSGQTRVDGGSAASLRCSRPTFHPTARARSDRSCAPLGSIPAPSRTWC